jgi:hypothetical protein
MQVRSDQDAARDALPRGAVRRFLGTIADYFSPTLHCEACGSESKQRHCERTGNVRPVAGDESWFRVTADEIEHVCPSCGASIWVLQPSAYYYPIG